MPGAGRIARCMALTSEDVIQRAGLRTSLPFPSASDRKSPPLGAHGVHARRVKGLLGAWSDCSPQGSLASSSRSQLAMRTIKACGSPDLGSTVRRCLLASTAVGGDCYSLGYSVAREAVL